MFLPAHLQTPLIDYLMRPDPSYTVSAGLSGGGFYEYELTSQTWRGHVWRHPLLLVASPGSRGGVAILIVTGDRVPSDPDKAEALRLAVRTGLPTAVLYDVPNQPMFDLREDTLIAHTFARFLETGDPTWPLLLPMAKSVTAAMDAVASATKDTDNPIMKFVVTGASKRGWTTYLASVDERVIGIAPIAFDVLNMPDQLRHMRATYGGLSEMIQDYAPLADMVDTPAGSALLRIVDPINLKAAKPKLIVLGANDPFWTVDSVNLYWADMPGPKALCYVPNQGHDVGSSDQAVEARAAFALLTARGIGLPKMEWALDNGALTINAPEAKSTRIWTATSETRNFRAAVWVATDGGKAEAVGRYKALVGEAEFDMHGMRFRLSTTPYVIGPQ